MCCEAELDSQLKAMPEGRNCTYCRKFKLFCEFSADKNKKYGVRSYCKKCQQASQKNARKGAARNKYIANDLRGRNKDLGISYRITFEDIESLNKPEFCPIFPWLKLDYSPKASGEFRPELAQLDRIVPELGYVPGNMQWVSAEANRCKNSMGIIEITAMYRYIRKPRTSKICDIEQFEFSFAAA